MERKANLINKAFNQYLWASVLAVAATQIANIVDAIIVGNLIGEEGLAAVNLNKPLPQTFFSVTCLYVASSTMFAGMAIGRGDRKAADRLFSLSMGLSLLLGVLFTAAGLLWFAPLSRLFCQSEALRPLLDPFMRVSLFSAVPQLLMLTLHQFVTVDGEPKLVSRAVIIGNVVNIILDIVFIKCFSWGIAGAAVATCVMYVVCILLVLPHFRRKESLGLCRTKLRDVEVGRIFSIGLPLFLSTVLLSVQFMGNNYVASRFLGDDGLYAMAVCMQLFSFSMIIVTGTVRTVQPVGAILKGLGDTKGMLMLMKRSYVFMAVCYVFFTALLVLLPGQIGLLLGVEEGSGLDMVKKALPPFSLNIIFQGLLCNLLCVFQFYERKGLSLLLSITLALLPMAFFFALRGNWIGFFVGQVVTGLAILACEMVLRRRDRRLCRILLIPMKDDTKALDITLKPTTQSLSAAVADLRSFLSSNGMEPHTVYVAAVCAEEFVNNIIRHGHASSIDLASTVDGDTVNVSIHDDGAAFNPVAAASASEAKIGLGLTLAAAFCQDMNYKYIFNQNMLTFKISNNKKTMSN